MTEVQNDISNAFAIKMLALVAVLFCLSAGSALVSAENNHGLHYQLTHEELVTHFGVASSADVDPESYQVMVIEEGSLVMNGTHRLSIGPSKHSLSENANLLVTEGNQSRVLDFNDQNCHFLPQSQEFSGVLENCNGHGYSGFLIDHRDGTLYKIKPWKNQTSEQILHIFTKHPKKSSDLALDLGDDHPKMNKRSGSELMVELGIFLDKTAYQAYMNYYNDENKVLNMVLTFINGIQALYHQPSLGRKVSFRIVHMEVVSDDQFNHYNGLQGELLESFCDYQVKLHFKFCSNEWQPIFYRSRKILGLIQTLTIGIWPCYYQV